MGLKREIRLMPWRAARMARKMAGRAAELRGRIRGEAWSRENVTVVINSFNRVRWLENLVTWLEAAGIQRIVILDNASQYQPLAEYLDRSPHKVVRLGKNFGPYAFWNSGYWKELRNQFFVLTDPDVLPIEACPANVIERMLEVMNEHRDISKVGLGLLIDDLPEHYLRREEVVRWESRFWENEIEPGVFRATVDTTFALYRPWTYFRDKPKALRLGYPYVARHMPWYSDSAHPDEEDLFYEAHAIPGACWWVSDKIANPNRLQQT